jgi:hypothetical protein
MASTYEKIATTTLSSAASTITFSSISGSYTDLVLILNGKNDISANRAVRLQFNSDTGSNYSYTYIQADGSTIASPRASSQTTMSFGNFTGEQTVSILNIQNYSNTTTYKTAIARTNPVDTVVQAFVGLWRSTAAITRIDLTLNADNFNTGCVATIYGILKAA